MEVISQLPEWAQIVLSILGSLVVLGTGIARLTPAKKDDEITGKVEKIWNKLIMILPSLGINPKTKKMQESLEELKESIKVKEVKEEEKK